MQVTVCTELSLNCHTLWVSTVILEIPSDVSLTIVIKALLASLAFLELSDAVILVSQLILCQTFHDQYKNTKIIKIKNLNGE